VVSGFITGIYNTTLMWCIENLVKNGKLLRYTKLIGGRCERSPLEIKLKRLTVTACKRQNYAPGYRAWRNGENFRL